MIFPLVTISCLCVLLECSCSACCDGVVWWMPCFRDTSANQPSSVRCWKAEARNEATYLHGSFKKACGCVILTWKWGMNDHLCIEIFHFYLRIIKGQKQMGNCKNSSQFNSYHRIIEPFASEGTFKKPSSPTPLQRTGTPTAPSGTQSLIQPDLESLTGQSIHHHSGQPVPVAHHPYCKKLLPYIQSKSPLFQFETISPCPIMTESLWRAWDNGSVVSNNAILCSFLKTKVSPRSSRLPFKS